MNSTVCGELLWFVDHVVKSDDKSVKWSPYDRMVSTLIAYSDALFIGMGFGSLGEYAGFQCSLPVNGPKDLIFFYEALVVYCAFWLGAKYSCDQITVYSDNTNTVDMFSSLQAKPAMGNPQVRFSHTVPIP